MPTFTAVASFKVPSALYCMASDWLFGAVQIDDVQSIMTGGDIAVGAADVDITGIGDRHKRIGHDVRPLGIGHVDDFQAVIINHKAVAELELHLARMIQSLNARRGDKLRLKRIVHVHDMQARAAQRCTHKCP